jgi:predicted NBD/HSP70 family sugar kinase
MSADERIPGRPHAQKTHRGDSLSGTNLERAGDHNQRVTLQAVRAAGDATVTRAEIADLTGLTPPAVANITNRLLKDGLIQKAGRLLGGRGQPATKLVVNPDGAFSIGLNIDRDHITIVALDFLGQVRARVCREVHFAMPDAVVAFFKEEVARIAARRAIDFNRLIGLGIAIPDDLGRIPLANRPDAYRIWSEIDVADRFTDLVPGPIIVENDATAAAIGEMQFGHGLQHRNFLYTLISAGLGGGLVVDGHYVRGADGRSGEIGFLPVVGHSEHRTLEDVVSLYALYDDLRKAGFAVSTPDDLEALPEAGLTRVEAWLDRAAGHLVGPFLVMNCAFNPAAHFIGGRLPVRFIESLCAKVNARLQAHSPGIRNIAPVKRAELAVDASARGAGILPFNERFLPIREALMKTA